MSQWEKWGFCTHHQNYYTTTSSYITQGKNRNTNNSRDNTTNNERHQYQVQSYLNKDNNANIQNYTTNNQIPVQRHQVPLYLTSVQPQQVPLYQRQANTPNEQNQRVLNERNDITNINQNQIRSLGGYSNLKSTHNSTHKHK